MQTELLTQIKSAKRVIGIVPRVKRSAEGEPRPTMVAICDCDENGPVYRRTLELDDEQDELDFVLGMSPVEMRAVKDGEDLSKFKPHHILRDKEGKPSQVPALYIGLQKEDAVVLSLGGSGTPLSAV